MQVIEGRCWKITSLAGRHGGGINQTPAEVLRFVWFFVV